MDGYLYSTGFLAVKVLSTILLASVIHHVPISGKFVHMFMGCDFPIY